MNSIKLILPLVAVSFILGLSSCISSGLLTGGLGELAYDKYQKNKNTNNQIKINKVEIFTEPAGAKIYNDNNEFVGISPTTISINKKLTVGTNLFTIKKDGYASVTYKVPENSHHELNLELKFLLQRLEATQERVNRDNAGSTDMEKSIIRWYFDSDPRGARIFWRVISSVPNEVKNTNETYLTTTPYEETRGFNIQGLTYNNSRDVTIEIKLSKRGYEDQVKRFNARQCLDQQEISGFFELIEKDDQPTTTKKKKKKIVVEEEEDDDE